MRYKSVSNAVEQIAQLWGIAPPVTPATDVNPVWLSFAKCLSDERWPTGRRTLKDALLRKFKPLHGKAKRNPALDYLIQEWEK